uniref:Capsule synthesis protein CapA domain-containing protein n=1 Tax=Lotharella globosa TaxID=91324 RepID=A0A7S3ZDQ5_9EUKA
MDYVRLAELKLKSEAEEAASAHASAESTTDIPLKDMTIPSMITDDYVWGDILENIASADARLVNLETSVTTHNAPCPKGINYRMHPKNVDTLKAAGIQCCILANNHVLDYGIQGLNETLRTLHSVHIRTVGAGRNSREAQAPAVIATGKEHYLLVFALGSESSGVPDTWEATEIRPGIALHRLGDDANSIALRIAKEVKEFQSKHGGRSKPTVVVSIHWGGNWGYEIARWQRELAHALVDVGGCDIVHGHSSHHPIGLELYKERLILYGCGDLINDYEGISGQGHERYHPDLALLYLPTLNKTTGNLMSLELRPVKIRGFRLSHVDVNAKERKWLAETLNREIKRFSTFPSAFRPQVVVSGKTLELKKK